MSRLRVIVGVCTRRIGLRMLGPTAVAVVIGGLCARTHPDTARDPVDTAAAWLQLPMLLVVAAAVLATIDAWPAFGRDRPDASLVERAGPGPLSGTGVAAIVGTAIAIASLAIVGFAFEFASGRPADRGIDIVHALSVSPGSAARIDARHPTIRLTLTRPVRVDAIEIRPRMPLGDSGGFVATPIEVRDAEGVDLGPVPPIEHTGQLVRVTFPPRRLAAIEIVHGGSGLPLFFPPGSTSARMTASRSAYAATVTAACTAAFAAALGLVVLAFLRNRVSLAVAAVVGIVLPIATTALGFTPNAAAVHAYARNEWPLTDATVEAGFWSLSAIVAVMLLALVTRRPMDAA